MLDLVLEEMPFIEELVYLLDVETSVFGGIKWYNFNINWIVSCRWRGLDCQHLYREKRYFEMVWMTVNSGQWTSPQSTTFIPRNRLRRANECVSSILDIVANQFAREQIVVAKHQYKVYVFYCPSLNYGT